MNNFIFFLIIFISTVFLFTNIEAKKCTSCDQYSWSRVEQKGEIPNIAWDGSGAYNERKGLFYVYGGLNGSYPNDFPTNDFFVFNVKKEKWINLRVPSVPNPRAEALLFLDEKGEYVYLSGGRGPFRRGYNIVFDSTFRYSVKEKVWEEIEQTLIQQNLANRSTEAISVGKYSYAFSGSTSTMPSYIRLPGSLKTDVIVFDDVNGWESVNVSGNIPIPRTHHHLIYNEDLNSIFTYGGYTNCSNFTSNQCNYLGDLWSLNLTSSKWNQHTFDVTKSPGNRDNSKFIYADKNQLIMIGGSNYQWINFMDVWRFDLNSNQWSQLTVLPLIDENTGIQSPIPNTLGSFYFRRILRCSVEFYFSRGVLGEQPGSPLVTDMYKLTIPIY